MLFDHEELRVYRAAIDFVGWVEGLRLQAKHNVAARDHLRRAAESVPVNVAEASGKVSVNERRQFTDTAYGSALECAACLDVMCVLGCHPPETAQEGKQRLSGIVAMLLGFRAAAGSRVKEGRAQYGGDGTGEKAVLFDHEKLDVYQRALDFVHWSGEVRKATLVARSVETTLDKTSTGVALNIAEGNGKFSRKDRCRFIGYARTAALQAAACLDVVAVRQSSLSDRSEEGKALLSDCVRMLVAWQRSFADA